MLWYDKPASSWSEALPVGTGRLGAMMHGDPANEVFYLNEDTVWSGGPHNYAKPGAYQHLDELRQLIFDGKYDQAVEFGAEHSLGNPRRQQTYQSLGRHLFTNCIKASEILGNDADSRKKAATFRSRLGVVSGGLIN